MDSMISVGGKLAPDTVGQLGEFVATVFREGREHGMDPETIRRALALIEGCVKAEHVAISYCTLTSDTKENGIHLTGDPEKGPGVVIPRSGE